MKIAATTGGGLLIGFNWSACDSPKMKVISDQEIYDRAVNFNSFFIHFPIQSRGDFFHPILNWGKTSKPHFQ
ncbi:Isoquinoline 1-oxidoreductase beta subunit [Winogradskyella psychrotolerans RS-3]|uniref:Isoquinoline 1-oxidoreductase beta subunit n=1 Tax=Winogradskyella psychrotolerans RS-3 TaxID=641526 RepID=S7XE55_9FLAO|nr:Isoquinoline 1-oxidoreductase beta subunit [Winogradskyella psychrotolerans RS-3]